MLIDLIKSNDTEAAINCINQNPESIHETVNGMSAIMYAAYFKNEKILSHIQSLNMDFSIFDACSLGHLEEIRKQIENNPDCINEFSPEGFQPLGFAAYFGNEEVVELLLKYVENVNTPANNVFKVCPIHSAVAAQSVPIVKMLLSKGADPNIPQQKGILPIHSAAHLGNVEILKMLMNAGAKTNVPAEDGKTLIDYAGESENKKQIIEVLDTA